MSEARVVATGTWFYDGVIPHRIEIRAFPARYSATRFAEHGEMTGEYDESVPVTPTEDGLLYECTPFYSGEHLSVQAAKAWADSQPWAPVHWDWTEGEDFN